MDLGINGKRALVCASSKGLGLGCAQALAAAGVDLVMNARGVEALEASAQAIRDAHGVEVATLAADVTTQQGQNSLLEAAGQVDILVTNAGGPPPGLWSDWDRDDFIKRFCQRCPRVDGGGWSTSPASLSKPRSAFWVFRMRRVQA